MFMVNLVIIKMITVSEHDLKKQNAKKAMTF